MDRRRLLLAGNAGLGLAYLALWLTAVLRLNSVPLLLVLVAAHAHILAVDLAAMVLALPHALFPELAKRTYGGPSGGGVQLGLLFAAYPAGVLLAGLLSGTFSRATRHGALMASAAMIWGGCAALLGLTGDLWIALIALLAGGAVNFMLSTFRNAISQAYTDDALRGRIQGAGRTGVVALRRTPATGTSADASPRARVFRPEFGTTGTTVCTGCPPAPEGLPLKPCCQ